MQMVYLYTFYIATARQQPKHNPHTILQKVHTAPHIVWSSVATHVRLLYSIHVCVCINEIVRRNHVKNLSKMQI